MRIGRAIVVWAVMIGLTVPAAPVQGQSPPESICLLPEDERTEQPEEPVELCGETTLQASSSGVLLVTLVKQVTIDAQSFHPGGGNQIDGEGSFVGLVMTEDLPRRDGRLLLAGRVHREPTPGHVFATFGGPISSITFPPGQYRLYVLAAGSPVTVTLHFAELDGHVELAPLTPNRFDVRSLEPRVWDESGRLIYSAGEDGELQTYGLNFQSIWARTTTHVTGRFGTCFYDGPSPEPFAFLPECRNGSGATFTVTNVAPGSENVAVYSVISVSPPGTYGNGAFYEALAQVTSAGSVVFWLDMS